MSLLDAPWQQATAQTQSRTITAGQTQEEIIQPLDPVTEWVVIYATVVDGNIVDVNDTSTWYLENAILGVGIPLTDTSSLSNVSGIGAAQAYPNYRATQLTHHWHGLILKRTPANESWIRLKSRYVASATVGNRGVTRRFVYAYRPRSRPF